jgi:aspartate kinase
MTSSNKPLIVQKYGGSSLAKPEQIQSVADSIKKLYDAGHQVLVVVSAMGKTTDQLVDLAYKVSTTPNRRELDMLLTTGERISMALMSMALNDRGVPSISFTGSQAGILTDELHSSARIVDVKSPRVEAELGRNHVVVLAGFQGVSPVTKEITTLGRGGSDTSAVAMAAGFKAERCEIRKDVDGVYSADPHVVGHARHLPHLHYQQLLDMTFWGAKVLHYRSVELAALLQIPLVVTLAHGDGAQTLIDGNAPMYEQARILSVNSHKEVRWIRVANSDLSQAMQTLSDALREGALPVPQILDSNVSEQGCSFLVTAPSETLNAIAQLTNAKQLLSMDMTELSSVTATCQGSFASPLPDQIAQQLARKSVMIHKMLFGAMSLSVIVDAKDREKALQAIHDIDSKS